MAAVWLELDIGGGMTGFFCAWCLGLAKDELEAKRQLDQAAWMEPRKA